ncbi:MAG TPA: hypothetical protein VME20_10370 [Acidimicrobiales bacterium]|nr:hypothetical protein [Acidimicrobiales bacterium]
MMTNRAYRSGTAALLAATLLVAMLLAQLGQPARALAATTESGCSKPPAMSPLVTDGEGWEATVFIFGQAKRHGRTYQPLLRQYRPDYIDTCSAEIEMADADGNVYNFQFPSQLGTTRAYRTVFTAPNVCRIASVQSEARPTPTGRLSPPLAQPVTPAHRTECATSVLSVNITAATGRAQRPEVDNGTGPFGALFTSCSLLVTRAKLDSQTAHAKRVTIPVSITASIYGLRALVGPQEGELMLKTATARATLSPLVSDISVARKNLAAVSQCTK